MKVFNGKWNHLLQEGSDALSIISCYTLKASNKAVQRVWEEGHWMLGGAQRWLMSIKSSNIR